MTVLTHSKCHMRDCTVRNFGTRSGSATLHFEDDATLEPPDLLLADNHFGWQGPDSIFPFGIFTGPGDDDVQRGRVPTPSSRLRERELPGRARARRGGASSSR